METPFSNLQVVLFEPQGAGNLGSVARSMGNYGAARLVLVNPSAERNEEAFSMAVHAREILERAAIYPTLETGLTKSAWAVGFTACRDKRRAERIDFHFLLDQVLTALPTQCVALVFGREDSGLPNECLDRCRYLAEIPVAPEYRSLNLSHAVLAVLFSLYTRRSSAGAALSDLDNAAAETPLDPLLAHATVGDREGLLGDLLQSLRFIGFLREEKSESISGRVRRIIEKAPLTRREIRILRGICRQWRWAEEERQ